MGAIEGAFKDVTGERLLVENGLHLRTQAIEVG
jgi:hypothetical protein